MTIDNNNDVMHYDGFVISIDRAALLDDRSFPSPSRNNRPMKFTSS